MKQCFLKIGPHGTFFFLAVIFYKSTVRLVLLTSWATVPRDSEAEADWGLCYQIKPKAKVSIPGMWWLQLIALLMSS